MQYTKTIPAQANETPDMELIEQILGGSKRAWNVLLRRYRGLIYRCITKVTSRFGRHLCQDDVDEVFCEFSLALLKNDMRKLRAYDPNRGAKLGTWLGLLAINAAHDHLRARGRRPRLDHLDRAAERPAPDPTPLDRALVREQLGSLKVLLDGLTARDRRFVRLYFDQGLEAETIAETMNISVKTVYTKKHKIRNRLRDLARERPALAALAA